MRFSRVTARKPVGKSFCLNGPDVERHTLANVASGIVETMTAASLSEFLEIRDACEPNQFLVYGVCGHDRIELRADGHPDVEAGEAIARTQKLFKAPEGAGILCIDHDPDKDSATRYDWRELDAIFCKVLPQWASAERQWRPSSSAMIKQKSTGKILIGPGSWKAYTPLENAADAGKITRALFARLCEAGYGRTEITKGTAARVMIRTLIDPSMWEPWRPDFINPVLGEDLERC